MNELQLITIDDIEALGDIGSLNVEAISKALSKNRGLTPENVHLFYDSGNSSLALFDAIKLGLTSPALETLAYHNANPTSVHLNFCGHLDDTSFKVFTTSLPSLQRLELLGPFFVRPAAWQAFLKFIRSLKHSSSPRPPFQ
ncbi:hypothetical protein BYT27DRAFT_7341697 [Phlegmacium glaucopus]|nr:hypothetical protein BYT27DRAFT_7341697 [Phlegmacium glaucopus]